MDYSKLSDFEINKRAAESLNPNAISIEYDWENTEGRKKSKRGVVVVNGGPQDPFLFNPCNNPSDAWPIILENRISIVDPISLDGLWTAFVFEKDAGPDICHKNPLRAAMIVYLMMQEA